MERQKNMEMEGCRQRILNYADSLKELAGHMSEIDSQEELASSDRYTVLVHRFMEEKKRQIKESLENTAAVMEKLVYEELQIKEFENRYRRRIEKRLKEMNVLMQDVFYQKREGGQEKISILLASKTPETGRKIKKARVTADSIARLLSEVMGMKICSSQQNPYYLDKNFREYTFFREPEYITVSGFAKATKEGKEVSGDCLSIIDTENGESLMMISDGTGSGEKAFEESDMVLELLEMLIEKDFSIASAIEMINFVFYVRDRECYNPTLDLCQIKKNTGECQFFKQGAVSSFIKIGPRVEEVKNPGMPLGMMENVVKNHKKWSLGDGGLIVMISDGVSQCFTGMDEISVFLENCNHNNPEQIANDLLKEAILNSAGHISDDMTVVVCGVWKNKANC